MTSIHNTLIFKACRHALEHKSRVTAHGAATVVGEVSDKNTDLKPHGHSVKFRILER